MSRQFVWNSSLLWADGAGCSSCSESADCPSGVADETSRRTERKTVEIPVVIVTGSNRFASTEFSDAETDNANRKSSVASSGGVSSKQAQCRLVHCWPLDSGLDEPSICYRSLNTTYSSERNQAILEITWFKRIKCINNSVILLQTCALCISKLL